MIGDGVDNRADDVDPRSRMDDDSLAQAQQSRFPVVASQRRGRDGLGMAAGVAGALALGAITFMSMSGNRTTPPTDDGNAAVGQPDSSAAMGVTEAPMPFPAAAMTPVPPAATAPAPVPGALPAMASPMPGPLPMMADNGGMYADRARAPALILDSYGPNGGGMAAPAPVATAPAARSVPGGLNPDESFAYRVGEGGVDRAVATRMSDPGRTVVQGTMISAVLETAINSDLPGYVRAFVAQDVRSFDNKTVLIPRGSRLIGQYKSGVSAGQTRAYVLWSRLIRPDGVSVSVASPGTDVEGETGLPGKVNSHFMKRFGASILLSIVGGVASTGSKAVIISGSQGAASVAAQANANIPPTIRVLQGQPIRVFTARDLDFSQVGE
jgi:type IV secretion system protein VirB10